MNPTVYRGLFFVLLGLSCAGCSRSKSPVLAQVGMSKITVADLRSRLKDTPPAYQQYVASTEGRRQFLNLLIREKILLAEAKTLGIDRDASYKEALERFKEDWKQRQKDYEETLLVESTLRRLRSKDLSVTDTEVQKYYDEHRADFEKPLEVTASHILVNTEAQGQEVLARLKAGEPFEKLALEMSKDPATAIRGGKLSPFRRGSLVPEFEEAAFRLKNGEISGIVKSQFGFHIIKKIGQTPLPPRSFDQAKEEIRAKLEREKFDQWVTAKQAVLGVQVDEKAVAQLSQEPLKP
jgi:peptidyl-prolyl cis-trans isomerase C